MPSSNPGNFLMLQSRALEDASRALNSWNAMIARIAPALEQSARAFRGLEQLQGLVLTVRGSDLVRAASFVMPRPVTDDSEHVQSELLNPRETTEIPAFLASVPEDPETSLARRIAARLQSAPHVHRLELALEYRAELEGLDRLEPGSTPETAKRRLQQFLRELVYGRLIALDDLPDRVRRGLMTGGFRDTT